MFKAVVILTKASLKQQFRSGVNLLLTFITPFTFGLTMLVQVWVLYSYRDNAFAGLNMYDFAISAVIGQIIIMIMATYTHNSADYVGEAVHTSELDILLLRPIPLATFKYFRILNVSNLLSLFIYSVLFVVLAFKVHLWGMQLLKVCAFICVAGVMYIHIYTALNGLAFYLRDKSIIKVFLTQLDMMVARKPFEVFPTGVKFVLLYILPYLLIHGSIFEILRGRDSISFWLTAAYAFLLCAALNYVVWHEGLKKYESIG